MNINKNQRDENGLCQGPWEYTAKNDKGIEYTVSYSYINNFVVGLVEVESTESMKYSFQFNEFHEGECVEYKKERTVFRYINHGDHKTRAPFIVEGEEIECVY